GRYAFDGDNGRAARPCIFGIRPEHIALGDAAKAMPFTAESTVEIVDPMGSDTLVWTKLGGQIVSFRVEADKMLSNGDAIRIGFDPASASAPFVATLVDVTGLVIYFSVALVIMRGTLL
ncbi:TOBE domain-containing protein, partial [Mesorhizobium sp. M8A.F.Ca.ET.167.01.1.1]|uniref:TOBE domain-containing protein n=1 Tax=Mesorhizobium sp. M8A.F.Ca.ET.167.01.1.1 TaxID=2563961 RepID=UPI001FDF8E79